MDTDDLVSVLISEKRAVIVNLVTKEILLVHLR